jgi:F0F1-type ATP synthase epsilon subunit
VVGGGHHVVLWAEAAIALAEADRLAAAESPLRRAISELEAAGRTEDRVRAAGALAGALERAGRTDEAKQVWTTSGSPVTAPTGR